MNIDKNESKSLPNDSDTNEENITIVISEPKVLLQNTRINVGRINNSNKKNNINMPNKNNLFDFSMGKLVYTHTNGHKYTKEEASRIYNKRLVKRKFYSVAKKN